MSPCGKDLSSWQSFPRKRFPASDWLVDATRRMSWALSPLIDYFAAYKSKSRLISWSSHFRRCFRLFYPWRLNVKNVEISSKLKKNAQKCNHLLMNKDQRKNVDHDEANLVTKVWLDQDLSPQLTVRLDARVGGRRGLGCDVISRRWAVSGCVICTLSAQVISEDI